MRVKGDFNRVLCVSGVENSAIVWRVPSEPVSIIAKKRMKVLWRHLVHKVWAHNRRRKIHWRRSETKQTPYQGWWSISFREFIDTWKLYLDLGVVWDRGWGRSGIFFGVIPSFGVHEHDWPIQEVIYTTVWLIRRLLVFDSSGYPTRNPTLRTPPYGPYY